MADRYGLAKPCGLIKAGVLLKSGFALGLEFVESLGLNVNFNFISMTSFIQRTTAATPPPDNIRAI
jgi:hypothetical protein